MADLNLSMKLLIDRKGRRVLFAEAGKDAVDFLFSILSLPLGSVASCQNPVWSIGNLYQSIEDLRDLRMIPNKNIDSLVQLVRVEEPTTTNSPPFLLRTAVQSSPIEKPYYKCDDSRYGICRTYVTLDPKFPCPYCSATMSCPLTLVGWSSPSSSSSSSSVEGGFVQAGVTYMITDDLLVKPMSTLSTVTLISRLNLKEVGVIEEKTVNLTIDNVRNLLRASLETKNALTTIFFEE
ncbi:uncharacterized protein LOC119980966 [Tripterygium wilfordii]|uniref:uncharacterized protein LOC119980966 n=1 Tax=Tripterygium wilfordii TaxID=458696 RepID=UPI0018F817C0|nr:uncharacterized protein LOC119980966 [Tripterygium wilfordii]